MAANYYHNQGQTPGGASGKKSSGKGWKILLIAILGILVISPVDIVPGDAVTVVGLLDDVAYVAGIIGTVISMVKKKSVSNTAESNTPPVYNDVDSNEKH